MTISKMYKSLALSVLFASNAASIFAMETEAQANKKEYLASLVKAIKAVPGKMKTFYNSAKSGELIQHCKGAIAYLKEKEKNNHKITIGTVTVTGVSAFIYALYKVLPEKYSKKEKVAIISGILAAFGCGFALSHYGAPQVTGA